MSCRSSFALVEEESPKIDPAARAHAAIPRKRLFLLALYSGVSLTALASLIYFSFFAASVDGAAPTMMGCRYFGYWTGPTCGLNGIDCQPFESDWMPIRCPTRCLWDGSSVLEVIGSSHYKGDSRICRAAIHAGVMDTNGGCALMRYSGGRNRFVGSTANGVKSQSFNSWFPKTFEFKAPSSAHHCTDLSWWILAVGCVATFGLGVFPLPPVALVHTLTLWGFVYVAVVTAPVGYDYTAIMLTLSTQFVLVVVFVHCLFHWFIRPTFADFCLLPLKQRVFTWGVFYVTPFHIMLHLNFFSNIPWLNIDVGGYKNTAVSNTAAYVVLSLLGLSFLVLAAFLVRRLYHQSLLRSTTIGYVTVCIYCALVFAFFNHTLFHLHHVLIGVLLLPLTRTPSSPAFFLQALGLGLFIQGYAAWGWPTFLDVLPVSYSLDVPDSPPLALNVTTTSVNLTWPRLDGVYGYACMLNGVMVYRGTNNWTLITDLTPNQTYYTQVSGIGNGGTDGQPGPRGNFTTTVG
ncbi:Aste57867_21197 [Aphanomyces stellatus]|uniref:Aste57867_21197 protein n=1 Tax=Aphanomyces stellatus TaxID=120398 RepID=A0A485LGW3_9STRA|nr:hypothetical protein As57867_021129 [Aphanomyces stellatus]VFT97871.1 Aste57867_21197 [Aphanomyces stellatus]